QRLRRDQICVSRYRYARRVGVRRGTPEDREQPIAAAAARGIQSVQSREHARARANDLRRRGYAPPDVRSAGRDRDGHERAARARQYRSAADVSAAGAVSVLEALLFLTKSS